MGLGEMGGVERSGLRGKRRDESKLFLGEREGETVMVLVLACGRAGEGRGGCFGCGGG